MDMRYQQGIGTPETLGVQPTVWKEPQMFKPKALSFPTITAGTSRDYGNPGKYVDTMPSRWGSPSGEMSARGARLGVQGLQGILTKGRGTGETMTSDAGSLIMTRDARGVTDRDARRSVWD